MILLRYVVGPIQTNCYVVGDEATGEVLVIDPGDSGPELVAALRERQLTIRGVFATHHHTDHTAAVHEVLAAVPDATFYMSAIDYPEIALAAPQARAWYGREVTPPRAPDVYLQHGSEIAIGEHRLRALHCPGHTPGSICLAIDDLVFTGDVLFQGSIGRSDFPGGNALELLRSIHAHLLTLPDDTTVLPGHGPASTIGEERKQNPFLQDVPERIATRFG